MPKVQQCEQCGAPLLERREESGCLHCLLQVGMGPDRAEAASSPADFGTRSYHHYEILLREDGSPWELGRGAMGVTYKAIDVNLKMPAALKVLNGRFSALPDARKGFLQEAQAAAQLRHPNVASVFHFGVVNVLPASDSSPEKEADPAHGDCFFAMEFIEGETLENLLRRQGPISAAFAAQIGLQVARALAAAEKRGLVHRDLQPANIMVLAADGAALNENFKPSEEAWVKVIDFGLAQPARVGGGNSDIRDKFLGTAKFASPEQLEGHPLEIRSDIFSLGCILWYALTGKVPFPTENRREQVLSTDQLVEHDVPPAMIRLLKSMLAYEPSSRPSSAAELCELFKECHREISSKREHGVQPSRFRQRQAVGLAFGLAAILLALAFYLHESSAPVDDKSIALLPFRNLSPKSGQSFFAEGLEDDLVASLVKIRDLRVISRKSAANFSANAERDLPAIGRALGVRHVLQGSLRQTGSRIVLQVSLVDSQTGRVRWAENYDRTLEDSISLQSELAAAIVDALDATLTPQEQHEIQAKSTTNPDAYLLYLRGLKFENAPIFAISDYEAARTLYAQALALDPNFALAHARLSSTLGLLYRFRGPEEALKNDAFREAREALRLQPGLGAAHLAKACCYYRIDRDFRHALPELEIARRLLPNDPEPASLVALHSAA